MWILNGVGCEGVERNNLEQLICQLHLENVVTLPGLNTDVLNSIKDCAAFILSSDYEGMPNVLIEAMCMGMPVISTDCPSGGPRDLIQNGKNGLLVEVNNVQEMTQAMIAIIKADKNSLLGKNAYLTGEKLRDSRIFEEWKNMLFRK